MGSRQIGPRTVGPRTVRPWDLWLSIRLLANWAQDFRPQTVGPSCLGPNVWGPIFLILVLVLTINQHLPRSGKVLGKMGPGQFGPIADCPAMSFVFVSSVELGDQIVWPQMVGPRGPNPICKICCCSKCQS